jgi:hypothetical protein
LLLQRFKSRNDFHQFGFLTSLPDPEVNWELSLCKPYNSRKRKIAMFRSFSQLRELLIMSIV